MLLFCGAELDLDFLERRQNAGSTSNGGGEGASQQGPIEISPESVDRVKVILLGAPAVGKTSIIQVSRVLVVEMVQWSWVFLSKKAIFSRNSSFLTYKLIL